MQKGKAGTVSEGGCNCDSTTNSALPFENMTDADDNKEVFLTQLKGAVTNGGTKKLWKKYGNRITMQFKERNMEAKVCVFLITIDYHSYEFISLLIHAIVCSGAIRASALLLCWATLPPTALLSRSDHNPTRQANLSPPLLHSLHFIGRTGHLHLLVRQDQRISHPHSTSSEPTDPAPTFHALLFLPTAVVFGTILQQYWLGKMCISNTKNDINLILSCNTCIITRIH